MSRIKICAICGEEFDYKFSSDGKWVNSNHRVSCYRCVPFGTRPKSNRKSRIGRDRRVKYDFSAIQSAYDGGATYKDLTRIFGISTVAISKAARRGDLITRTTSEALALSIKIGRFGKRSMSESARENLSKKQSVHNTGGKSKWYSVNGRKVQGTWERNVAVKLDEMGVKWTRPRTPFTYTNDSGLSKRYTPDFFLEDDGKYLEVKGYWWGDDKRKMELVIRQHPEVSFVILQKEMYERLILYGERVW